MNIFLDTQTALLEKNIANAHNEGSGFGVSRAGGSGTSGMGDSGEGGNGGNNRSSNPSNL